MALDIQKYELFQNVKKARAGTLYLDDKLKQKMIREVTSFEKAVEIVFFALGMTNTGPYSVQFEFKKAVNKHQFDVDWNNIRMGLFRHHYAVMGALLEYTRATTEGMETDPLSCKDNYNWDPKVSFLNDFSEEMKYLLSEKFVLQFVEPPSKMEIKLQRIKD